MTESARFKLRIWVIGALGAAKLLLSLCLLWILLILLVGFGTTREVVQWHDNRQLERYGNLDARGRYHLWVFWNRDGSIIEDRSGWYVWGFRTRALTDEEREGYSTGRDRALIDVMRISFALHRFCGYKNQRLPARLDELSEVDTCRELFVGVNELPLDCWGQPYEYELSSDGSRFRIGTLGRDHARGGDGLDRDILFEGDDYYWMPNEIK
jgi:hypothetical protein